MRGRWTVAGLGFGVGVALTLVAVKLNSDYWRNRNYENGQIHMSARAATGPTPARLQPPPIPGSRVVAKEIRQFENVKLQSVTGNSLTLAELRGSPVFLNVWETSCIPCVLEMPSIRKLSASLRNEPLKMVLVSFEDVGKVRDFAGSQPDLPVYAADERSRPAVLTAVPQTYILDRDGNVVFHYLGPANWDSDDVRAYLRGLMR